MIKLEYIPPFYQKYLSWIQDENVIYLLKKDHNNTCDFLRSIPEEKHNYTYRPGKWTIKQILLHLMDVERVFVYRALRFSRSDPTDLAGFDQDDYIENGSLEHVSFSSLYDGWDIMRKSTIIFYEMLSPNAMQRTGRAMGLEFTPESIGYILVGHTKHHISIIKEKYL